MLHPRITTAAEIFQSLFTDLDDNNNEYCIIHDSLHFFLSEIDLSAEDSISERRVLLVEAFFFGQEIPESMQDELADLLQLIPVELMVEYVNFFNN